jgi:hypothetical protein
MCVVFGWEQVRMVLDRMVVSRSVDRPSWLSQNFLSLRSVSECQRKKERKKRVPSFTASTPPERMPGGNLFPGVNDLI